MVDQETINKMLDNITDPNQRDLFGQIIRGDFIQQVKCNSDECGGRVIARKTVNNVWVDDFLEEDGEPVSGLQSSRERLDGATGFKCWCGQDTLVASTEEGIITANVPSKEDLLKIAQNIQDSDVEDQKEFTVEDL